MGAIPQLVLAQLIVEHFRRSHPQCEQSYVLDIELETGLIKEFSRKVDWPSGQF